MPAENHAAFLTSAKAKPLQVKSAPYTTPKSYEIVIANHALAINPIDPLIQSQGTSFTFPWLKYPIILGHDVAGEVVECGSSITRFKPGDRVLGHAAGSDKQYNRNDMCAFQTYTVLVEHMSTPLPAGLSYEQAAVVPLGLSTAACGMFQDDQLGLYYPRAPAAKSKGKTLLIWGASSSVGCNAIQLAVAAGYEVFATASPRNFPLLEKLGASKVFDYSSKTVVDEIVSALKGKTCAGALAISNGSNGPCLDIVHRCKGDKFVAMATPPLPASPATSGVLKLVVAFISGSIAVWIKAKRSGIRYNYIFGSSLAHNGVGKAVYQDFLPQALAEGTFACAPEPQVVGKGLQSLQDGFEVLKKGVSAKKVVVTL